MNALLLVVVVAAIAVAFALRRPAPNRQVIYVPLEVIDEPRGMGCLPLIIFVIIMAVALGLIRW